jgi:hypothetical protein
VKQLPSIFKELIDQFVKGPMSVEAIQSASTASNRRYSHGRWLLNFIGFVERGLDRHNAARNGTRKNGNCQPL